MTEDILNKKIPTYASFQEMATANAVPEAAVIQNMAPVGGETYADELDPGAYRFIEMPPNNISYRVAAIDAANGSISDPQFIFDKFRNKQDATEQLNKARNTPGCKWTGPDPSRMIHVEDYREGATYENLDN